jgi:hypothetical protein
MAAVMIGMLPVLGAPWVGILYMLAALVLVTVRRPWSFLLYGVRVDRHGAARRRPGRVKGSPSTLRSMTNVIRRW